MSGSGLSLNDMPGDVLMAIAEAVARISVKNRGASNEICSLSCVNKRLYAHAIKHIFRVINAQKIRNFSEDSPYTGMPPVALQHTRYLALGFPPQHSFDKHTGIRIYPSVATQFIAILSTAKNVKVVTIHAPVDVIDSFETQTELLGVNFPSVVELHYYPHPDVMYHSPILPTLFPNITTLVSLGFGFDEIAPLLEPTILPYLVDLFNRHRLPHLKHLQLHIKFCTKLLESLPAMGSRLETLIVDSTGTAYHWDTSRLFARRLVGLLNANVEKLEILQLLYERCPHIEVASLDYEACYELRRRSTKFTVGELVQKVHTTASSVNRNKRAMFWMRYLEPANPHQKVSMAADGVMSVVDINPILETPVLVDYPWGDLEDEEED
ncbi:hypothetical protein UCDDS831_g04233 [Diplodia seriata]|uniref:Uncharacterized protein n=1 Tax=Diplodia seriata TaxID=420778 RepID=A0A0G2EEV6_9PEZI|nr:hypothetical protein UCDDS831_g04233 [Diplodia seriata]